MTDRKAIAQLDNRLLGQQADKLIRVRERLARIVDKSHDAEAVRLAKDAIADLESFGQCYDRGMR